MNVHSLGWKSRVNSGLEYRAPGAAESKADERAGTKVHAEGRNKYGAGGVVRLATCPNSVISIRLMPYVHLEKES